MKISMTANLNVLRNIGNGEYISVNADELTYFGIDGMRFNIGKQDVPFEWKAYEGGWSEEGFLSFSSGRGWFFNDYELDSCYDEHYANIGLKREEISAEYLASVQHIEEFYINIVCNGEEYEVGYYQNNADNEVPYKLELLRVSFEDMESGQIYDVDSKVLAAFNKGQKGISLETFIADASLRSNKTFNGGKDIENVGEIEQIN